jgi:hypothetical protein
VRAQPIANVNHPERGDGHAQDEHLEPVGIRNLAAF